ncbi:hypothetical protein [Evtepia gabavorous]
MRRSPGVAAGKKSTRRQYWAARLQLRKGLRTVAEAVTAALSMPVTLSE